MIFKLRTGLALFLFSMLFWAMPSSHTLADVLFDMVPEPADFTRDSSNPEHSGTLTRDGITALFTAQGNDGLEVSLGDLNFSGDSFGMSIVDGINDEALLDVSQSDNFGDIHEQIIVSFDRQVRLDEITLDTFFVGDEAILNWGAGNNVSLQGTSDFTDIYNVTSAGIILNPGEDLTLLHVSGGGFSFESFRVTAVPEPGNLALLMFLGLAQTVRRRRKK